MGITLGLFFLMEWVCGLRGVYGEVRGGGGRQGKEDSFFFLYKGCDFIRDCVDIMCILYIVYWQGRVGGRVWSVEVVEEGLILVFFLG